MSGKTKRVQQAREAFGSTLSAGSDNKRTAVSSNSSSKDDSPGSNGSGSGQAFDGEQMFKGLHHGHSNAHVPAFKLQDLSQMMNVFKEEIWLIIPTTNVSRILSASAYNENRDNGTTCMYGTDTRNTFIEQYDRIDSVCRDCNYDTRQMDSMDRVSMPKRGTRQEQGGSSTGPLSLLVAILC